MRQLSLPSLFSRASEAVSIGGGLMESALRRPGSPSCRAEVVCKPARISPLGVTPLSRR